MPSCTECIRKDLKILDLQGQLQDSITRQAANILKEVLTENNHDPATVIVPKGKYFMVLDKPLKFNDISKLQEAAQQKGKE